MSQPADKLFEEAQALPEQEHALLALQLLDGVGEPATIGDREFGSEDPLAWEGDGWEACTEGRR